MREIVFLIMLILKEVFEIQALMRGHLLLRSVRIMLVLITFMMCSLIFRGIIASWPMIIQIIFVISLICDIIVICNKKILKNLLSNLGGNQE